MSWCDQRDLLLVFCCLTRRKKSFYCVSARVCLSVSQRSVGRINIRWLLCFGTVKVCCPLRQKGWHLENFPANSSNYFLDHHSTPCQVFWFYSFNVIRSVLFWIPRKLMTFLWCQSPLFVTPFALSSLAFPFLWLLICLARERARDWRREKRWVREGVTCPKWPHLSPLAIENE